MEKVLSPQVKPVTHMKENGRMESFGAKEYTHGRRVDIIAKETG